VERDCRNRTLRLAQVAVDGCGACQAGIGARVGLPVDRVVGFALDGLAGGEAEGLGAGPDDGVDAVAINEDPFMAGTASSRLSAIAAQWASSQCAPWLESWTTSTPLPGSW
jgi:hypothetical protein